MTAVKYVEACTSGRIISGLFMCVCLALFCFVDIFDFIYPIPDERLMRIEAIDFRNLTYAFVATGFSLSILSYLAVVLVSTLRHMEFPYPSMKVPIRLKIRVVEKSSTIWLFAAVVLLSLVLQLTVIWYTWSKWHNLLIEVSKSR